MILRQTIINFMVTVFMLTTSSIKLANLFVLCCSLKYEARLIIFVFLFISNAKREWCLLSKAKIRNSSLFYTFPEECVLLTNQVKVVIILLLC